ncbi:hypothetical protein D6D21_05579 [Aureobasidium pullulans]|uniref:DUF6604 domain-containing protein n=1 Tax=Aureobasidium pullulans TaxID=5580 RepID=A0AB74IWI2_AURPU|nr:hypothetical protein D6D21_05579 [Aureobasidium pullulans]
MEDPVNIHFRYKRVETTVFVYIHSVQPKIPDGQRRSCRKIEEKVYMITQCPPEYIVINLKVVIELRERCAIFFEEALLLGANIKDAVSRHRFWIDFLKRLLGHFIHLEAEFAKVKTKAKNKSKKKSNPHGNRTNAEAKSRAHNEPKLTAASANPFEQLEVEQVLEQAHEEHLPKATASSGDNSDDPEWEFAMPEEADDQFFRAWCRQQYLASGRDGLLKMWDEVHLGRFDFEAAATTSSIIFRQMRLSHESYAEENPNLQSHAESLILLDIPVPHMSLPIPQRKLTMREKILVAEEGSITMACFQIAQTDLQSAMDCANSLFCKSVLEHFNSFKSMTHDSVAGTESYWWEMSVFAKHQLFPSYLPFIIEVLSAVHDYFHQGAAKIYENLRAASKGWLSDLSIQQRYGQGSDILITVGDCGPKYSIAEEETYDPEDFKFYKTMIVTMGAVTRKLKSTRYSFGLATYNQGCMMLGVAHLYSAAKSHGVVADDEIWPDMELFLERFVPAGKRNLQNHAYGLGYARNHSPISVLTCFLLGIGVPKKDLGMNRQTLINDIHNYRKGSVGNVQITPTSPVWIITHEQALKDLTVDSKVKFDQLRAYHGLFRSETPGMQEIITKMCEHELEQDDLLNFDLNGMLNIVKCSSLDTGHGDALLKIAGTLNKFAKSRDSQELKKIWKELVPGVKKQGSQGVDGLARWKASMTEFGPNCGEKAALVFRNAVNEVKQMAEVLVEESFPPHIKRLLKTFTYVRDLDQDSLAKVEEILAKSTFEGRGQILDALDD